MHNGTKGCQISANAIFNWWDNQIMKGGVHADADCWDNQITDNTGNYYQEEAVRADGRRNACCRQTYDSRCRLRSRDPTPSSTVRKEGGIFIDWETGEPVSDDRSGGAHGR